MKLNNKHNRISKNKRGRASWGQDLELFFVLSLTVMSILMQLVLLDRHYRLIKALDNTQINTAISGH